MVCQTIAVHKNTTSKQGVEKIIGLQVLGFLLLFSGGVLRSGQGFTGYLKETHCTGSCYVKQLWGFVDKIASDVNKFSFLIDFHGNNNVPVKKKKYNGVESVVNY